MHDIDSTVSFVGWWLGMFITFLVAMAIATSEGWKEGTRKKKPASELLWKQKIDTKE
jgi:hypothetical protein